jgi:protein phosphatase
MAKAATAPHQPALLSRGGYSDRGLQRKQNEDAYALPPAYADEAQLGTLVVVADGVGSLGGGKEASWDAVQYLQALYYARTGPEHPAERLRECVEAVNLLNRATQHWLGQDGERLTTLVAAVIYNESIWVANVGDSRAYLVQAKGEQLCQLTEDHTVKAGFFDDQLELAIHQKGAITQAIGLEEQCQVDIYHYRWQPGDRLVLCSDGLASLTGPTIAKLALAYPPEVATGALVAQANKEDGSDNSTVVIVGWEAAPVSTPAPAQAGKWPGSMILSNDLVPLVLGLIMGWLILVIFLLSG